MAVQIVIFDPDLMAIFNEEIRINICDGELLRSDKLKITDELTVIKEYLESAEIVVIHISQLSGGLEWVQEHILEKNDKIKVVIHTGRGVHESIPLRCIFWKKEIYLGLLQLNKPEEWIKYIRERVQNLNSDN